MGTRIQCPKSDITQLTFQLPDEVFGLKSKTLSTHLRKPVDRTPVRRRGFVLVSAQDFDFTRHIRDLK